MMQITSSISSLGDNQPVMCALPLALRTMQHNMLKHVVDLSSTLSVSESWKMDPSLVLSLTQDEVYEGVGEPIMFSPMCATHTRLSTCRRNTSMGVLPTCSLVRPLQPVIVNTSTGVSSLALQDAHIKLSSSVVTDVSVDTRALKMFH